MLASAAVMARQLVIGVVLAVAGSSLGACTQDDDWYPMCDHGEGPLMETFTAVSVSAKDLTCVRMVAVIGCDGECCHAHPISESTTPTACEGLCVALDEASCARDARCYVARDFAAFYRGAPDSFLGCFPNTFAWSSDACELRNADGCASNGMCAGLYHRSSSDTFVECVGESVIAGSCTEVATCMKPPPSCSAGRTPGVAAGCYTGACIPNDLCAP